MSTATYLRLTNAIRGNKMYMNIYTGSVDSYDGWDYIEYERTVNAVDRGEVVEVQWNEEAEQWKAV